MALTDSDKLQMTAIALMKHSVITKTATDGGSGLIVGVPAAHCLSVDGKVLGSIVGTATKIE